MRWAITKTAYAELERQRHYISLGEDRPMRWEGFLADTIAAATGVPVARADRRSLLAGSRRLFAWNPGREAVLFALRRRLTYISWGTQVAARRAGSVRATVRNTTLRLILKRAQPLLVNERITADEIRRLVRRDATVIPHFIDATFWSFRDDSRRESFLFCPSTNDRDGEKLLALARAGHQVTWLANDKTIFDRYSKSHPSLSLIKEISYAHMRMLFQTCRAVVLPLRRDLHAAGQTTSMEAIACGAPVYLSAGRTATIFEGVPSVRAMNDTDWQTVPISAAPNDVTAASARWLRETHIPRLRCVLDRILTAPDDDQAIQAANETAW